MPLSNIAQSNWDDLKFILAVVDHGSVSGAARALDVNHATVLRRIAAFEARYGLLVFERSSQGYQLLPDRLALIEAMRSAGEAVRGVERLIESERPAVGQGLRVTSTESFCHALLPPVITAMSKSFGVPVQILCGNQHLDFSRMQADLTVRPAISLPDDLAGEQAGVFRFGVFSGSGVSQSTGWVGLSGPLGRSPAADWMRRNCSGDPVEMSADSFLVVASLAAESGCRALLPVFLGDSWPGLTRIDVPNDLPPVPIWVATHVDLEKSGRLSKARRFLIEEFGSMSDRLSGGS